jgi:hypothetical protein
MCYNAQGHNCTLMATAMGVSQEKIWKVRRLCLTRIDPNLCDKTISPELA